jgi:hypothetical protein
MGNQKNMDAFSGFIESVAGSRVLENIASALPGGGILVAASDWLQNKIRGHIIFPPPDPLKRQDVKRTGWGSASLIPDDKGRPIPIVYGTCYVNAAIIGIDNAAYYSAGNGGYIQAGILLGLCYGKALAWQSITAKEGEVLTYIGDYTTNGIKMIPPWPSTETPRSVWYVYNDGTQATEIPLVDTGGNPVTYKSSLNGIAWIYINQIDFIQTWGKIEKRETWPRVQTLVLRRLSTPLVNTEVASMELQNNVIHVNGCHTNPHSYGDNPAAIAYDLLTNTTYGLGVSTALIDLDSFNTAAQWLYDKRYGLNFQIDQTIIAEEIFTMLQSAVDIFIRINNSGKFEAIVKDPAHGETQMTFTDADMIGFSTGSVSWESTYNFFSAKCFKAGPNGGWGTYDLAIRAPWNMAMQGAEKKLDLDLTMFNIPSIAEERLSVIAKRMSTPITSISFNTSLQAMRLLVGDLIQVENVEFGISGTFRILEKTVPSPDSNMILLCCELASEFYFDKNAYTGSGGAPEETVTQATEVGAFQTLVFAPFSGSSGNFAGGFTDPTKVRARWSLGQAQAGELLLGTDFTVVASHIVLDPTIFAEDIQANSLGLMSVDVWEIT